MANVAFCACPIPCKPRQMPTLCLVRLLYPYVWFLAAISSVSSGAQVAFPQTAWPPTGSIPMPAPQVLKRAARFLAGTIFSPRKVLIIPISAVSLVSPASQNPLSNQPDQYEDSAAQLCRRAFSYRVIGLCNTSAFSQYSAVLNAGRL